MASSKREGGDDGEAVVLNFSPQSPSQASTTRDPILSSIAERTHGKEARGTIKAAVLALDALEEHKRLMLDNNRAGLAEDLLGIKRVLWKHAVKKMRSAWMANIKLELASAEGVGNKWTVEGFQDAKLAAGVFLGPLFNDLLPEDEKEDMLAAMCDENIVEGPMKRRETEEKSQKTKPDVRAARANRRESLEQEADLLAKEVVTKTRILKNLRKTTSSLTRPVHLKHAVAVRRFVDRGVKIREELASAKLEIKHSAALEAAERERASAKKASSAALDALAKANRALSMCDGKLIRLLSLKICGAAWGWATADGEELPSLPPLGVRVYRPKGGVSKVFPRLLIGRLSDGPWGGDGSSEQPGTREGEGSPDGE